MLGWGARSHRVATMTVMLLAHGPLRVAPLHTRTMTRLASERGTSADPLLHVDDGLDAVPPFGTLFDLAFHSGRCIGVRLPDGKGGQPAVALLPPGPLLGEEVEYSRPLARHLASQFLGGRLALRLAMGPDRAAKVAPVLRNDRGAPVIPPGLCGSISHKDQVAVALVLDHGVEQGARDSSEECTTVPVQHVGVDLENLAAKRRTDLIRRKLLTWSESHSLGQLSATGLTVGQEVLLHFSFKEAAYKAMDPFLQRHIGFTEIEVRPATDGRCSLHVVEASALDECVAGRGMVLDGSWTTIGDFVLTAVTARMR